MAHDADEAEQYHGTREQLDAIYNRRGFALDGLLLNRGTVKGQGGHHTDNEVDGEQHTPTQAKGRNGSHSSPHGDIGRHERGNGLDKLTEGERRGEVSATNHC